MDFLKKMLEPKEAQLREIDMAQIGKVLESSTVRDKWMDMMVDKIRSINLELDRLLDRNDKTEVWTKFAVERRALIRVLSMILDANDELESEKAAEEARTRLFTHYQGASAPLDARPYNAR